MLVIGVTRWTGVARLVRGEFLRLRAKDFVTAGKALGYSDARVIFRHILPNALAPVLVAATFGAILTTWVTFLPCFLWIFAGAPFIERLRGNRALSAALSAITAAVVGVILNLAVWFGIHTLFEQVREVPFAAGTIDLPVLTSVNWPALALAVGAEPPLEAPVRPLWSALAIITSFLWGSIGPSVVREPIASVPLSLLALAALKGKGQS